MDGRATLRVVQALESWAELEAGENEARRELEAKTRSPRRASTSYYRNRSRNVLASPPAQLKRSCERKSSINHRPAPLVNRPGGMFEANSQSP
jgi:hypothetical protein